MTQTELKNGINFHFNNERWCEENESDDIRGGSICFNNNFTLFAIHFNGKCIHTSKTFNSSKQRLEKLMGDWECEFTLDNEFAL